MNYIGITIGPISEVISKSRKTRHVWGASYLFSYLMKQVLTELNGAIDGFEEKHLLIPALPGNNIKIKTGITPDRIILQVGSNNQLIQQVLAAIKNAEETTFKTLTEERKIFAKRIIRIYAASLFVKPDLNPIPEVNKVLNTLDLQHKYHAGTMLDGVEWTKVLDDLNNTLFFKEENIKPPFLSVNKIAAKALEHLHAYQLNDEESDKQDLFYTAIRSELNKNGKEFNNFYKYIAVVTADGDKINDTIKKLGNSPFLVKELAAVISAFSVKATREIQNWGALPVYVGGDDIKFFSPVAKPAANGFETIFTLIDQLSTLFTKSIAENDALVKFYEANRDMAKPTLSFGIHISYYKYPLNETVAEAESNLYKAKKQGGNGIAFSIRKHSGQYLGSFIQKHKEESYNNFLTLVGKVNPGEDFLSSIMYNLTANRRFLSAIKEDKDKIYWFLENSYNEPAHDSKRTFLREVATAITVNCAAYPETASNAGPYYEHKEDDNYLNKIYSALRFVHFVNDTQDER